jgi:hypothetical protein
MKPFRRFLAIVLFMTCMAFVVLPLLLIDTALGGFRLGKPLNKIYEFLRASIERIDPDF